MREKLGVAAFVVLLVAVWGVGFLWVRGDLPGTAVAKKTGAETTTQARPAPASPSVTSGSPSSSPLVPSILEQTGSGTLQNGAAKPVKIQPMGRADHGRRPVPQLLPPVVEFKMATFNILGSSHTGPGGHHSWLASGPQRISGVLALLRQHSVTVLGMQEFQPNQRAAFSARAGGWARYPDGSQGKGGENSVAWRTDTWDLVKPGVIDVPYFFGRLRPMPYVLLRHKETGITAYFSSFHNPANVYGPAQRFRAKATVREIGLFRRLEATGVPQFVTGDMNERAGYFCRVTGATSLKAAQGGSHDGGCRPPTPTQIDWILGSPKVEFTDFNIDRSPLVRRTSDHPFVSTTVRIDAIDYDKAFQPEG